MEIFAHHLMGLHFLNDIVLVVANLMFAVAALVVSVIITRNNQRSTRQQKERISDDSRL